jgi:hypothetical protein
MPFAHFSVSKLNFPNMGPPPKCASEIVSSRYQRRPPLPLAVVRATANGYAPHHECPATFSSQSVPIHALFFPFRARSAAKRFSVRFAAAASDAFLARAVRSSGVIVFRLRLPPFDPIAAITCLTRSLVTFFAIPQ